MNGENLFRRPKKKKILMKSSLFLAVFSEMDLVWGIGYEGPQRPQSSLSGFF